MYTYPDVHVVCMRMSSFECKKRQCISTLVCACMNKSACMLVRVHMHVYGAHRHSTFAALSSSASLQRMQYNLICLSCDFVP